jgi:peptidoglycan/xylan/chitin deacetylase (PgdA/CDA1 family)
MILDILKKHNVKATFFVIGSKAELNPEIIKRIDKEGHLIGSHSFTHHYLFDLFSSRRMENEMIRTDNVIYSIIGKRMKLFRPPYGVTNPTISKAINNLQYLSIGWSLKSGDTVIKNESKLIKNVISKVKNGDIILFHDNKPWNVKAIDSLMGYLNEKGYSISRLDEFLTIHAYVY